MQAVGPSKITRKQSLVGAAFVVNNLLTERTVDLHHCALKWITLQPMTNQSLRARFRLGEDKAAIASQVITATIDARLIKVDPSVRGSRKFARYQPFWA